MDKLYIFASLLCCIITSVCILLTIIEPVSMTKTLFFRCLGISLIIWAFFSNTLYMISDREFAVKVHMLKYIGLSFIPVFTLFHIISQLDNRKFKIINFVLFSIIPILTIIFSLTDNKFHLMYKEFVFINEATFTIFSTKNAFWFYVHSIYSYVLLLLSLLYAFKTYLLLPKTTNKPVAFMLWGLIISSVINLVYVMDIFNINFDISIIACQITFIFFYRALKVTVTNNLILTSRDSIYDNLADKILILDINETIIDTNKTTAKLAKELGIELIGYNYKEFINLWLVKKNGRHSEYDENVVTITNLEIESHYIIYQQNIFKNEIFLGCFVNIQDITKIYKLLRYVEESAFYDQLTKLHNRNYYMKIVEEWSGDKQLPLGIIVGDLDNLKVVNDSNGHIQGDNVLIEMAEILKDKVPKHGMLFRIGGDEFVIFIPNSSEEECNNLVKEIEKECIKRTELYVFSPSISLGIAIRKSIDENISELVKEADIQMYKTKRDRRKNRE